MKELENRLILCKELKITLPPELFEFLDVLIMGGTKHGADNWLQPNGSKSSHKDMHSSMFRHLAESSTSGATREDGESGLDPLLHLASRSVMMYTRIKRGIIHSDDLGDIR